MVSILAKQEGLSLVSYPTKAGKSILMLDHSQFSAEEMLQRAEANRKAQVLFFRLSGVAFMFFGLRSTAQPVVTMMSFSPVLAHFVGEGINCVLFPIALVISGIVMSLAWVAYRPAMGLLSIVGGAMLFVLFRHLKKSNDIGGTHDVLQSADMVETEAYPVSAPEKPYSDNM